MSATDGAALAAAAGVSCSSLRRACITLLDPTPTHSKPDLPNDLAYRKPPAWKIEVYGPSALSDTAALLRQRVGLKDPLKSTQLRHLERNIFAKPNEDPPIQTDFMRQDVPYMLWPEWEAGFSEVIMWTLLPLGYLSHMRALPNTTWMLSGALFPRTWEPLRRASQGICTFERYDIIEDATVVGTPLPRCPRFACFKQLRVCEMLRKVTHLKSYLARAALDATLGFPPTPLNEARAATRQGHLRVLFALRSSWHGRHITNAHALAHACSSLRLSHGWRVTCICRHLGSGGGGDAGGGAASSRPHHDSPLDITSPLHHTINLLRSVDVLVSMHGGDCINALHLRPGRTLVEVVNAGFDEAPSGCRSTSNAPWIHRPYIHTHR